MKRVVVSGATGFIGGALTEELLNRGIYVYGIGRDEKKLKRFVEYSNYQPICLDFDKFMELPNYILGGNIDVFYHFAWDGGFTEAIRDYHVQMQNAIYAGDTVIAAYNLGCKKFVHAGTYNEYEILTLLQGENIAPRYTCIYAAGKTAADIIARTLAHNMKMEYSIGLIPMPYGEENYSRQLINVVLECLIKKMPPKLVEGNNLYDLVYIKDIAKAFIAIGERGKNQKAYYVGHRELKTFREWMIEIRDIVDKDVELKFGEYEDCQTINYDNIDLNALYKDTGFECSQDFEEGIIKTVQWMKDIKGKSYVESRTK